MYTEMMGMQQLRTLRVGISSKSNQDLLKRLLEILGIVGKPSSRGIEFQDMESIVTASKMPFFRNATDRRFRLEQIVEMRSSMTWKPVTPDELKTIMHLHREGYTDGEITALLWAEHHIARGPATIRGIIKRQANKKK